MEKTKEKEKERICPFNETLECEDCRLYIAWLGGGGRKTCAVILSSDR